MGMLSACWDSFSITFFSWSSRLSNCSCATSASNTVNISLLESIVLLIFCKRHISGSAYQATFREISGINGSISIRLLRVYVPCELFSSLPRECFDIRDYSTSTKIRVNRKPYCPCVIDRGSFGSNDRLSVYDHARRFRCVYSRFRRR